MRLWLLCRRSFVVGLGLLIARVYKVLDFAFFFFAWQILVKRVFGVCVLLVEEIVCVCTRDSRKGWARDDVD